MSLAASTGGLGGAAGAAGGAGGLTLAHQSNAMGRAANAPPNESHAKFSGSGVAPPSSASALGADVLDKQQGLSMRQVRNVSNMPIVAVDLHASSPHVAMFPAKPDDTSKGAMPILVGKMNAGIGLRKDDENAHKTLRKYLSKSKTYSSLSKECLSRASDPDAVHIDKPHLWLGLRRVEHAPDFVRKRVKIEDSGSTPAIAEESTTEAGVFLTNSTLDGSSIPAGDDFDRAVYKVRLHPSKKALTVLPEEATELLLRQAQFHVAAKVGANPEEDCDDIMDYPLAVALPAWALHDAAVEALHDASSCGTGAVFFQRGVCALAGALLPGPDGKPNAVLERLNQVRQALHKEYQIQKVDDPTVVFEEEVLVLLYGMTDEGFECAAVHVTSLQPENVCALFGHYKVLSNVSYRAEDPLSKMEACSAQLEEALEAIAPEADGPAALILYGTSAEQNRIKSHWETSLKKKQKEWSAVPVFTCRPDSIVKGAAVLGGVCHGRSTAVGQNALKPKPELGIRVQNVAPVAVGIRSNYFSLDSKIPDKKRWSDVKTIFDFDRRVPAGPYPMELKASECAVHRSRGAGSQEQLSEEEFLKQTKSFEGSRGIPAREEAALNYQIQFVQKWTRDGEWINVGDVMEPLVDVKEDDDGKQHRIACESTLLEVSLGVTGMITTSLVGDRESVVQATKSARNSFLWKYFTIGLSILFFGGFFVKSYWEEHVFKRDTERLLAYYKHVVPGSMNDGDRRNARYLVYKYRNKKQKLWATLEKKYGAPVKLANEWDDDDDEDKNEDAAAGGEEENVDLDDDEEQEDKETKTGDAGEDGDGDEPEL